MANTKQHWENIYTNKSDNEVSWFQEKPQTTLKLIEKYTFNDKSISIADIGGGNSILTLELVEKGFSNISVLDISAKALDRNRERVKNVPIKWIECDVLTCNELNNLTIWHDRAVLHFLTNKDEIKKYVQIATKAIIANGYLIIGAFSETGPDNCSGLPVIKYSESLLKKVFEKDFDLVECFEETHTTPFNSKQNFIWGVLRKKDNENS
jgi:hypothetical protein